MQNVKAIDQLKVLDNEVKIKILALLADTGAKSITDISRLLNLNFSTAHKYLEQLENAGFVKSRQETENRLKRMFYIQDFCVHIDPRNVSQILGGGKTQHGDEAYGNFNIITNDGRLEKFNKFKFAKPYLDAGIPKNTIEIVFDTIKEQIYDGITLLELKSYFDKSLYNRLSIVSKAINKLNALDSDKISDLLAYKIPEALESHISGRIFIQNINKPRLLNFVHDLRGVYVHGITGKRPKNIDDLFEQLLSMIFKIDEISHPNHGIDSFNYFILPLTLKLNDNALIDKLSELFHKLSHSKIQFSISLDVGLPRFTDKILISPTEGSYKECVAEADRIIKFIRQIKPPSNVSVIYKIWDSSKIQEFTNETHIIDMTSDYGENSSFVGDTRVSSDWKGWYRTVRVGEIQNIHLNLALLAKNAKDSEFIKNLNSCLDEVFSIINVVGEKSNGYLIKQYNYTLKSAYREKWEYIAVPDLIYTVSLYGLNEVAEKYNIDPVKIISLINKRAENSVFRISVNLTSNPIVTERFERISGIEQNLSLLPKKVYKYLNGGYLSK